ncbi:MAG: LTA synthase family protein [Clostridia bacterium]|nr:LTA synthase family protein [Clostridia bacterium]
MKRYQKSLPTWVKALCLGLFPTVLTLICEFNAAQSFSSVWHLIAERTGALVFSCLMSTLLFGLLIVLIGRGWIAALCQGILWFILSGIEFFKADVSGSHFLPSDIALITSFGDTVGMAKLRLEPGLVLCALVIALCVTLLWYFSADIRLPALPRTAVSIGIAGVFAIGLLTPAFSSMLGVNSVKNVNVFVARAKVSDNGFFAFFADETRALLDNATVDPGGYSEAAVADLLAKGKRPTGEGERPNVIVILSESHADFRSFEELEVSDENYACFDRMISQGAGGVTVVPAFGGYTTKSEFEVISGLPVLNAGDVSTPQDFITVDDAEGMPDVWREFGYETVYVHPFKEAYYLRNTVYPKYGFSRLLFREDLPLGDYPYRHYGDDKLVFDTALSLLSESEKPVYMHIMSMQNHQPYYYGLEKGQSELDYYLEGIAHTDRRLGEFLDSLEGIYEPTLVFFVGDHMPFFSSGGENVYSRLGIDDTNCGRVYEQRFAIWANYKAELSEFARDKFSLFYLPHMLLATAVGEELPDFSAAMLALKETCPVYTRPYQLDSEFVRCEAIDIISYDRLRGREYSSFAK